jgi:hypothetical protein
MTMIKYEMLCLSILLLAATSPAFAADDFAPDFGDSVRHMIEQQTYDPRAAAQPPVEAPNRLDGARAEAVLKAWRTPRAQGAATMPQADFGISGGVTP